MDPKEINDGKVLAILCYLIGIVGIVMLIVRNNAFALYHAKQWLILFLAAISVIIPTFILSIVLGMLTRGLGSCLIAPLFVLTALCTIALAIIGVINAANGVCKPLPYIGTFAEEWFKGMTKKPTP